MRQTFEFRAIIGTLIWIGLIAIGIMFARQSFSRAPEATNLIAQYVGNQRRTVELNFPYAQLVSVGDAVYLGSGEQVSAIGVVSRVKDEQCNEEGLAWADRAFVTLYGSAPQLNESAFVEYHAAPDSSAWVLQTMLPPEKRRELTKLIVDSYQKNQNDIVTALRPVVEASLKDASAVIREDLKNAFEAREDRIRKIGQRYQSELVEKEIVPLVQSQIMPIVKAEGEPLASEIGQEIWNEVSMFRFGWRYIYDKTPLPDKKLTEKEFKRFVDEKAVPILESHVEDIVAVQQSIMKRIVRNEQVKATISKSIKSIVNDPEVQELMGDVFQEVFVGNDRLKGVLEEHWKGPEAQRAMAIANDRLEPTITEIGMALFGSPREKITPEFARVLRHRILHKDSRWLTLHIEGEADPNAVQPKKLPVRIATEHSEIPYAPARSVN
jgi:hypothetical protein